jgi:hypothetical protein
MRISTPRLCEADGMVRAEARISSGAGEQLLWFGVAPEHAGLLAVDRADGFLVAQLLLAMRLGEPVELNAPLSGRLYYNLVHHYQPLMQELMPELRPVAIHAPLASEAPREPPTGVGTGFSAGIDSFAVIHDHLAQPVPEGFRLTHLTFNNVGSHGTRDHERARRLFRRRYDQVRGYPDSVGLPFIAIDSNLGEALPLDFEQTHTTRNLAVALVLQPLFHRYYYASTFHYRDIAVEPTFDSAFADALAVPLLSTESLDLVSAGGQHTRVEKTRLVAGLPGASRWLNVCATESLDGRNCSTCLKCCRTLFTLELLGRLDEFAVSFDLDRWRQVRNRYISTKLLGRGPVRPLSREIHELVRETGFRYSPWQRVASWLLSPVPRPLYRLGRSIRRRWFGGL